MSERRKIEDRIKKKEQEIQSLEAQINDARVYIQALQDVLKMIPREAGTAGSSPLATLRAGSTVAKARDAILREGKPLHITELLPRVGKEQTKEARLSLAGSLAAYVRRAEIFTRPAPNTFGLIELGHSAEAPTQEPPADFGLDDTETE